MVRKDIVQKKVGRAAAWLRDAQPAFDLIASDFVAQVKERDLAIFYLFLAIQECIDLAGHWVADAGWGPPDDFGSTFDLLADKGVIDHETADFMRSAAGLRNRIAHGYAQVDYEQVHRDAAAGIPKLFAFLETLSDQT